jgi:hypothetical protein
VADLWPAQELTATVATECPAASGPGLPIGPPGACPGTRRLGRRDGRHAPRGGAGGGRRTLPVKVVGRRTEVQDQSPRRELSNASERQGDPVSGGVTVSPLEIPIRCRVVMGRMLRRRSGHRGRGHSRYRSGPRLVGPAVAPSSRAATCGASPERRGAAARGVPGSGRVRAAGLQRAL